MPSSSSACNDCAVIIELNPQCKLEIANSVVYSIGTQQINYTVIEDDCECLESILINGSTPPVCVTDGQLITVLPTFHAKCCICREAQPTCVIQSFALKRTNQGLRLMINKTQLKQLAMRNIQRMRKRKI